jgi:hypothetical protein
MAIVDKRKHPRVETNNKIAYVIIDDLGNEIDEGVGEIINVSLGGILMETIKPIGLSKVMLMAIGIDDKMVNIKGDVTHSWLIDSGTFRAGVQFLGNNENTKLFVTNLIKNDSKQTSTSHDSIKII